MKKNFCFFLVLIFVLIGTIPLSAYPLVKNSEIILVQNNLDQNNNNLSKAVEAQTKDALKDEVNKIGGSIVDAVRALFITFFAVAVMFMGLQTAGGGLKDPRRVELIKGSAISATVSAVLVYKAEAIVAFMFDLIGVDISSILK